MIKLSIIIPSWNTEMLLRQCLKSISAKFEIIVVENGSTDGSAEMVKKEFPEVILIENKENVGFGKANNQAAIKAKGDYLLFLNSDTIVKESSLEQLIGFLDNNQEVGAVSPLLLNEDGSFQLDPCYLKFPSPLGSFVYYNKILRPIFFRLFPSFLLSARDFINPVEVDQLPGAALMIRKKIFDKTGGFDIRFPIYFEDTDLSFQIRKQGMKLFIIPQAKITHFGRKSIKPVIEKEGISKFLYFNFNSLFLFSEKNYSKTKDRLIKLAVYANLFFGFKFKLIQQLLSR